MAGPRKNLPYQPHLNALARELRKHGTLGEVLLWQALKKKVLGVEFHRQVPVMDYILDFFCPEKMLAVEVDGSTHRHPDVGARDVERQERLEALGIRVIRFTETEVRQDAARVVAAIAIALENPE
ncbi:MAG: DUF559 domain-containing protein [Candidatus Hydrogenedentes bacterium]|nr:DUF559 domain-containing protein [Candidatus Hydrogenedentota bacterium]